MTASKPATKKMPADKTTLEVKAVVRKPTASKKPGVAKPNVAISKGAKDIKPSANSATIAKKEVKPKKVKLVRDSFTMPSYDYDLIDVLKVKALGAKVAVKKSELLRAGLHALNKLDAAQLVALVKALTILKTGRPKK